MWRQTLENHHALSNRRTGLCDLEANHRGDGRMTAENQLDLLFEDHHRQRPNGDDVGRLNVRRVA
jgi:hypothetical protein